MRGLESQTASTIRAHLLADHAGLERLLEKVFQAFEGADRSTAVQAWADLDRRLLCHLDAEERYLVPALRGRDPRNARAVLAEHRHLRERLRELGVGVELHLVDLRSIRGFIDELRAHAAHEDRMLYRFTEETADESTESAVRAALARAARRSSAPAG